MTEHTCDKEAAIATLLERSSESKESMEKIEKTVNKIFLVLEGNGKVGLKEQVALHGQRLDSFPSIKALVGYASIGASGVLLIAYIVKTAFGG